MVMRSGWVLVVWLGWFGHSAAASDGSRPGDSTSPLSESQSEAGYVIGIVPQYEVRQIQRIWQPVLEQIRQKTGIRLTLRGSPSIPAFEDELDQAQFDFAYMNPYHFIRAHERSGYRPLVRDTGRWLRGILVVRSDSELQSVEALDGRAVAFPAPNALGASLLMRAELGEKHGVKVLPRYVRSHSSVYLNVATSHMDAGGGVQATLNRQSAQVQQSLRILYRTEKVAPHPLAVHPRVPADVASRVREALLAMGETEDGKALLARIPVKVIGDATLDDYRPLKAMKLDKYYEE
ncbi:phosphate/phosphite/phosphonate ABC transporter substrate-binding protein [Kistimonas scapharcae]|uniref:Phosphate/phosphite/phosphonate ABC transporter substrate-binding protein n=1 Tax=Kistimonas scapharcae TaxID=1036133 RepID=A0ABP8V3D5_9GAMM